MAKFVLADARLIAGGADLSSAASKISIESTVKDEDTTTFGSNGWTEVIGGLASTKLSGEGWWEANDPSKVDDAAFAALGGLGPWTVCPAGGGALATLAYFTNALEGSYQLLGEVGKVAPWTVEGVGSWPVVRGQIAHPPGTARTSSGTGTGAQLGAVATGKQLYAALHVLSIAGTSTPTITVAIESDTSNAFGAPTTRLTFGAATAVGGQILRVAGPITDTWFRPKWTVSGTTPSFLFALAFGIA
jgi:hypothetical protein